MGKLVGELYNEWLIKRTNLENNGYIVIFMWEDDYKKILKSLGKKYGDEPI